MGYGKIKTEMKGDTSRWGHREEYKQAAKKRRRTAAKIESSVYVCGACAKDKHANCSGWCWCSCEYNV